MILKKYIFIFLSLLVSLQGLAFESAEANQAYDTGNYELAATLYSEALLKEGVSAGLLYNLGNTYFQLGNEGEAILCFERAKKIDPGNKLINQNLHFLQSKIVDANKGLLGGKKGNVEPDAENFVESIYRMIAIDRASNGWAVFAVIAFILFIGAMGLYTFTPNILARKTGFFSGIAFLSFTVIFIVFAFLAANNAEKQDEAILMSFTTELLKNPEENASKVSSPLKKGTKIQILDAKKGTDGTEWLQVKLNSQNIGWVKKQDLEII